MATAPSTWKRYLSLDADRCALEARKAHLEVQLAKISQDLAAARRRDAILHNEKAAIFRLTDDILSKIFTCLSSSQVLDVAYSNPCTLTVNRSGATCRPVTSVTRRSELDLSHVCQRWRNTTLQTATLWGTFWCHELRECADVIACSQRLKQYLSRSGPAQDLELYFDFTLLNPQPESATNRERYRILVSEMLNLTVPHARRWKNLTIIANDATRRVSLSSFQRAISCISTPRLERLVVCVGHSYCLPSNVMEGKNGWEDQIFLLRDGDDESPCPRLQYVKLDGAGLGHCRPRIQSLAHLALEVGPPSAPPDNGVSHSHSFLIDWPAFLSSDILKLPHLETLSLHEDILNKATFPFLGKGPVGAKGDANGNLALSTELPTLKHLRIGGSFEPFHGPPNPPTNEGSFLLFFLRLVSAPALESFIICGYMIDSNPWGDDLWAHDPKKHQPGDAFNSLKALVLSDVYLRPKTAGFPERDRRAPFAHLVRRTSGAQSLTLSQSQVSGYLGVGTMMETGFQVVYGKQSWIHGDYWPHATSISINVPATSIIQGIQRPITIVLG